MDASFERDVSDISFKELLHQSPTLHEKTCSNVSWSCLQKGHNRSCAYFFLKLIFKSRILTLARNITRAVEDLIHADTLKFSI